MCYNVVNESGRTAKRNKKLWKLKVKPCKRAGFETLLSLAVGKRIILRRNIDVAAGVVNGRRYVTTSSSIIQIQEIHENK
uniref:DNA helicase Pif1-like 2B domain-containing protein n=1 Tax=Amphimedon queenslandica TaxID=400682 RepID=A0A1X7SMP4_AMPQE